MSDHRTLSPAPVDGPVPDMRLSPDATADGTNPAARAEEQSPAFGIEYRPYFVQDHWFAEPYPHPTKAYCIVYRLVPVAGGRYRPVFASCTLVDRDPANWN